MKHNFKHHWYRTPHTIRKPVVLIVGLLVIIASGLVGWLPGPGGIPLFLVGIAILATEFVWAQRVKEIVLSIIRYLGRQFRAHRVAGIIIIALLTVTSLTLSYFSLRKLL